MGKPIKGGTPATKALHKAGIAFTLHEYDYTAAEGGIGIAAAQAMNVEPARTLKTLIVAGDDGNHAMALVRVDFSLDLKAVAKALKVKRITMAETKMAERLTGYIKGGISPFGQKKRLAALIDAPALGFATIFVSGGQRGLEIEVAPADLVTCLNAQAVAIGRP